MTPSSTHLRFEGRYLGQPSTAAGTLSTGKNGDSGSIDLMPSSTLMTAMSGRWTCGKLPWPVRSALPALLDATRPPVADACWQPGQTTADGDRTPVTCANGGVNLWAWTVTYPGTLLRLGPHAKAATIKAALCHSILAGSPTDLLQSDYQLTQAYYDWPPGVSPEQLIAEKSCA
ncbi:MAG: hypothetical protein ACRDX8_00500 [Acidimicrobiales bacterium]